MIIFCTATRAEFETKIIPSEGGICDYFGGSVCIENDVCIVSSSTDDDNGEDSGSAYIFYYDGTTWLEQQKLLASDGDADDRFGYEVSLSGNFAVVGCHGDDDYGPAAGAVYVFHYNGENWVEYQKLTASDGEDYDQFGYDVSISGDNIIVGSVSDDDNGHYAGATYIFHYIDSAWIETQKLTASDGEMFDLFGHTVSINNNLAVVGARGDDDDMGSAYIFALIDSIWIEQEKLTASDRDLDDHFGSTVTINEEFAVIGAKWDEEFGYHSGSAYVFRFDGTNWMEQQKLLASDGAAENLFGYSVSISENNLVVGAIGYDTPIYLFQYDGIQWLEEQQFYASDGDPDDYYGGDVFISNNRIITGAIGDDDNNVDAGAAYVFDLAELSIDEDYISPFPSSHSLLSCYPNPFNPTTTISIGLPEVSELTVEVFNILGETVKVLADNKYSTGYHRFTFKGSGIASGIYFIHANVPGKMNEIRKVVLMK